MVWKLPVLTIASHPLPTAAPRICFIHGLTCLGQALFEQALHAITGLLQLSLETLEIVEPHCPGNPQTVVPIRNAVGLLIVQSLNTVLCSTQKPIGGQQFRNNPFRQHLQFLQAAHRLDNRRCL